MVYHYFASQKEKDYNTIGKMIICIPSMAEVKYYNMYNIENLKKYWFLYIRYYLVRLEECNA